MPRSITAATKTATAAQSSEFVHLLELEFLSGTVRFVSGPHNVTWNGNVYSASGSAMSFEAVSETPDPSGQRLRLILDGVTLTSIASLLGDSYIGRFGRLYRAHLDSTTKLILADPILLFVGLMNANWEVSEDPDNQTATVTTELVSPLAILNQVRGITADLNSHQAHFPGDTFFSRITTKPQGIHELGRWRVL